MSNGLQEHFGLSAADARAEQQLRDLRRRHAEVMAVCRPAQRLVPVKQESFPCISSTQWPRIPRPTQEEDGDVVLEDDEEDEEEEEEEEVEEEHLEDFEVHAGPLQNSEAIATAKASAAAEAMAHARKELLLERAKWQEEKKQLEEKLKEAKRASLSQETGIMGLDLFEVGPWLAQQLPKSAANARPGHQGPEILLDELLWPLLGAEVLTTVTEDYTLNFGIFVGAKDSRRGILRLSELRLCPQAFVWHPNQACESQAALQEDLCRAEDQFLSDTFLPWAEKQEAAKVAWLLCNHGEAFSLSRALLAFGQAATTESRWRSIAFVLDRTKGSTTEPAVEALALAEGRRMVFDVS